MKKRLIYCCDGGGGELSPRTKPEDDAKSDINKQNIEKKS